MSATLSANFDTRRSADMAIERLVQEFGIERTDIFVVAEGEDNTVGQRPAGSDATTGDAIASGVTDAPLLGAVKLSVDVQDDEKAKTVRAAFVEFGGQE